VKKVCDILLHWIATRDWKAAFYAVVPPRKFEKGKKAEKLRKRRERRATKVEHEDDSDEGSDFEVIDEAFAEGMVGEPSSETGQEGSSN
jgi:hypothetical protein